MKPIGIVLLGVGSSILIWPDIINYVLAIILITLGINILFAGALFARKESGSFKVGDYEILKRKK